MKEKKRIDFETNQALITESYVSFLKEKNRRPSYAELSKMTNLSKKTIGRHFKILNIEECIKDLKLLTPNVLLSLYEKTKEGKAAEIKLWMQIIEGWKESQNVSHEGKIQFEKINFVYEEQKTSDGV